MKIVIVTAAMFFSVVVYAQTKGDSIVTGWLATTISFRKPDSNFVALTDRKGYTFAEINATITASLFPGDYLRAEEELKRIKSTGQRKLLDTLHHLLKSESAFTLIQEESAPQDSRNENFILITSIIPNSAYTTFMVVGVYPKSHDNNLRKKFIEASLSIKAE